MSNTATVAAFIAAWEARDTDRIMGFFAEGAVWISSRLTEDSRVQVAFPAFIDL